MKWEEILASSTKEKEFHSTRIWSIKRLAYLHYMKLLLLISNFFSINQYDLSESAWFVEVESKGICEKIMIDTKFHILNSWGKHFRVKYLQKVRSRKSNKKQFQLINRDVWVVYLIWWRVSNRKQWVPSFKWAIQDLINYKLKLNRLKFFIFVFFAIFALVFPRIFCSFTVVLLFLNSVTKSS